MGIQIGAMLLHRRQRTPCAELNIRVSGSETDARPGLAGLDDEWPPLRRGQRRQRTTRAVILALEINHMNFLRIGEDSVRTIEKNGIPLDTIPQRAHHMHVLVCALIAAIVVHQLGVTEVRCFVLGARRDCVPGNPSLRDVIERVEDTGDVERMMICRRHGEAETDTTRYPRHTWDPRHHILHRPARAVANRRVVVATIILGRGRGVAEEQHVHDATRGRARDVLVELRPAIVRITRPGAGNRPEIVRVIERKISCEVNQL